MRQLAFLVHKERQNYAAVDDATAFITRPQKLPASRYRAALLTQICHPTVLFT